MKPDPLVVSGGIALRKSASSSVTQDKRLSVFQFLSGSPKTRLAFYAMVISHVTMVAVMTMTPVHLREHGHETVSAYIISLHIAGMYAFSPLVGRFSDRHGRLSNPAVFFPSLWLLGVGWSFGLIGSSSLLVDSVPIDYRVKVQGSADVAMSLFGGVGGFSSGFIRKAWGFPWLSMLGTIIVLFLLGLLLTNIERFKLQEA